MKKLYRNFKHLFKDIFKFMDPFLANKNITTLKLNLTFIHKNIEILSFWT